MDCIIAKSTSSTRSGDEALKCFSINAMHGTYECDSYAVNIGPDKRFANEIVRYMKRDFWVSFCVNVFF